MDCLRSMGKKKPLVETGAIKVPRFESRNGFVTDTQRSRTMSRIKGKDTKAELLLRRALFARGLRFRLHQRQLPGSPDIVLGRYRLVVFVDGAFWHGYQWALKKPKLKSNVAFWVAKIERTIQRDLENRSLLEGAGYTVMRFWDHQVVRELDKCVNQVMLFVESARSGPIPALV